MTKLKSSLEDGLEGLRLELVQATDKLAKSVQAEAEKHEEAIGLRARVTGGT